MKSTESTSIMGVQCTVRTVRYGTFILNLLWVKKRSHAPAGGACGKTIVKQIISRVACQSSMYRVSYCCLGQHQSGGGVGPQGRGRRRAMYRVPARPPLPALAPATAILSAPSLPIERGSPLPVWEKMCTNRMRLP